MARKKDELPHEGVFSALDRGHEAFLLWLLSHQPQSLLGMGNIALPPYSSGPMAGGAIRGPNQSQFDVRLGRWRDQVWPGWPMRQKVYDEDVRDWSRWQPGWK